MLNTNYCVPDEKTHRKYVYDFYFSSIYTLMNEVNGVCPSVCADSCLAHFCWFDIGLPYLAHGCISMRQCVTYIYDPDSTLAFDLKVKFIGFCPNCNFCLLLRWHTIIFTWVYHFKRMCFVQY